MNDDLLDALTCVVWARSKFESLEERIEDWLDINLELNVIDPDPNSPNNVIVARHEAPIPPEFNVEVGALTNTIRCSLDLLATVLAERHGFVPIDDVYFPVVKSEALFLAGPYKGFKFVNALPIRERALLESLKPYQGGNPYLWPLHQLDIMRKHRKLLTITALPGLFRIEGQKGIERYFTPVSTGLAPGAYHETIIGLIAKNAPQHQMSMAGQITFSEPVLGAHKRVIDALEDFAIFATETIEMFSFPWKNRHNTAPA